MRLRLREFFGMHLVPLHRLLTISGSVLLGVASTLLTEDTTRANAWAIMIGAGCVVYAGDVFSGLHYKAEALARSSNKPIEKASKDLFIAETSEWLSWTLIVGIVLIITGLLGRDIVNGLQGLWAVSPRTTPTATPTAP